MEGSSRKKVLRPNDGSRKHHYIPEYFTKGFVDAGGMVWMYDKQAKRYLGRKAPSQVFYLYDDNTAFIRGQRNTIAEQSFMRTDHVQAERVKAFLACPNTHDGISDALHARMSEHMLMQYFRSPRNRAKYDLVFDNMKNWSGMLDGVDFDPRMFGPTDTLRQLSKAYLPRELFSALLDRVDGQWIGKTYDKSDQEILVLTDNPVVYLKPPVKLMDLLDSCMLAMSSRRLYVRDFREDDSDPLVTMIQYNVMAIEQADRIVCASSKEFLVKAVEAWEAAVQVHNEILLAQASAKLE